MFCSESESLFCSESESRVDSNAIDIFHYLLMLKLITFSLFINGNGINSKYFRWPYLAAEIISCEVNAIIDAIFAHVDLLVNFWKFLDQPEPLNHLMTVYFSKVNMVLLTKRPDLVRFSYSPF